MPSGNSALLQGTLGGLILKALTWGPSHGYGIARWIRGASSETLNVEDRALYLALHRLEENGWVEASWGVSDNNRRAKFYRLTSAGRRELRAERARLTEYARAVIDVFGAASPETGR